MTPIRDDIRQLARCDNIPGQDSIVEKLEKKIILIDYRIRDIWAAHNENVERMQYGVEDAVWKKSEWITWLKALKTSWSENVRKPQSSLKLDLSDYITVADLKKDEKEYLSFLKWRCSKIEPEGRLGQKLVEIIIQRKAKTTETAAKARNTALERKAKREIETAERNEVMSQVYEQEKSKKLKYDTELAQLISCGLSKQQAEFCLKHKSTK
ncbi:MAG: hypothetical protein JSR37_01135 [Verrucomicrobia bacterium]|nr:hypothetical protein [Verrucomicrobiota bacterium]